MRVPLRLGYQFSDSMTDDGEDDPIAKGRSDADDEDDEDDEELVDKGEDEEDDPLEGWAGGGDLAAAAAAAAEASRFAKEGGGDVLAKTFQPPEPLLDPGLYLVGTPIGNLEDITLRALRVLRTADAVLAEDTRHTRRLLSRYGIDAHLVSYHAHNERQRREPMLQRMRSGAALALVGLALFTQQNASN
jgi:16S rRNA (cytidine1402-2'-O)-methyltransferase